MVDHRRRQLLASSLAFGALSALPWRGVLAAVTSPALGPVKDRSTGLPLLQLPPGFEYLSFGWTGDKLDDGTPTPPRHDGMSVVRVDGSTMWLVRNHEVADDSAPFAAGQIVYDPYGGGGCTVLQFDTTFGRLDGSWAGLAGTTWNCAGGPTPWGTWLSCEERVPGPGDPHAQEPRLVRFTKEHGLVYEVQPTAPHPPRPLPALGRFCHEAAAVDPKTGRVYLTEDRPAAGLYRFTPTVRDELARGGVLEMLAVDGVPDLRKGVDRERAYPVRWVRIEDPLRVHAPGTKDTQGVFAQGVAGGGTSFARLEGAWFGAGVLHFDATIGGDAGSGQVWRYDPRSETVRLVFESPGMETLSGPDNLTLSPRGGLLVCEDGDGSVQRLIAISKQGAATEFARNNIQLDGQRNGISGDFRIKEFAGASFSPDGKWLFVNVQTPGISFAITGPWALLGL